PARPADRPVRRTGGAGRRVRPARADRPPRPRAAPPPAPAAARGDAAHTASATAPGDRAQAVSTAPPRTAGPALRPPRAPRSSVGRPRRCPRRSTQDRAALDAQRHVLALAERVLGHLLVAGDDVGCQEDE